MMSRLVISLSVLALANLVHGYHGENKLESKSIRGARFMVNDATPSPSPDAAKILFETPNGQPTNSADINWPLTVQLADFIVSMVNSTYADTLPDYLTLLLNVMLKKKFSAFISVDLELVSETLVSEDQVDILFSGQAHFNASAETSAVQEAQAKILLNRTYFEKPLPNVISVTVYLPVYLAEENTTDNTTGNSTGSPLGNSTSSPLGNSTSSPLGNSTSSPLGNSTSNSSSHSAGSPSSSPSSNSTGNSSDPSDSPEGTVNTVMTPPVTEASATSSSKVGPLVVVILASALVLLLSFYLGRKYYRSRQNSAGSVRDFKGDGPTPPESPTHSASRLPDDYDPSILSYDDRYTQGDDCSISGVSMLYSEAGFENSRHAKSVEDDNSVSKSSLPDSEAGLDSTQLFLARRRKERERQQEESTKNATRDPLNFYDFENEFGYDFVAHQYTESDDEDLYMTDNDRSVAESEHPSECKESGRDLNVLRWQKHKAKLAGAANKRLGC